MSTPLTIGMLGFGAAFVAYGVVLALVLVGHPETRQAFWLIAATIASMLWAGTIAYMIWSEGALSRWLPVLDVVHIGAWTVFLGSILRTAGNEDVPRRISRIVSGGALTCVLVVVWLSLRGTGAGSQAPNYAMLIALLALPLLGLLALEQIFRNSVFHERRIVRPMTFGIGLVMATEVYFYSQAAIFGEITVGLWQLRGIANTIAAPLILIAVNRQPDWDGGLFVSRHVVFHTASLIGAGVYLLALGIVGSTLRPFDGSVRAALELVFLAGACAVFVYGLFSTTMHRRFKVLIAKHFYKNRYDYREEWLRLIGTLAGDAVEHALPERSVRALAEIIGSSSGELWMKAKNGADFEGYGAWRLPVPIAPLTESERLVRFLAETGWVIDTQEYELDPEHYANAFGSGSRPWTTPSIFVPLIQDGALVGITRLERPAELGKLSFEDHDLLKTAGRQVAIFLAQERTQSELAETRQLEAYSKLTTFLMHDLKNLISQQELVVGNARRFKHRPEFIDDAIRTIESSVGRMKQVLDRLQGIGAVRERRSRVDLAALIEEIGRSCADRAPVPRVGVLQRGVWIEVDRDRLASALNHAVRNAQDATPADGTIELALSVDGHYALVEISDSGMGMDPEFVRDRLFKPFDSTKGAKGMGIGAYQLRETLTSAGGRIDVTSALGRGTCLHVRIPLIRSVCEPSRAEPNQAAG